MTVCTKGAIASDLETPFPVLEVIDGYLSKLVNTARRACADGGSRLWRNDSNFASPSFSMTTPGSGLVSAQFCYKGEQRTLTAMFGLPREDCAPCAGPTIQLSMGDSGLSRPLMKGLLRALGVFGPAYFLACDCVDEGYEVLPGPRTTLADLDLAGVVRLSHVCMSSWLRHRAGSQALREAPESAYTGFSKEDTARLTSWAGTYEDGVAETKRLLSEYAATALPLDLGFAEIDATFDGWVPQ